MAKGHITINEADCKSCEFCIMVCPKDLREIADYYNARGYTPVTYVVPAGQCTGYTLCAMLCPEAVITVYREVRIKSDLQAEIA